MRREYYRKNCVHRGAKLKINSNYCITATKKENTREIIKTTITERVEKNSIFF